MAQTIVNPVAPPQPQTTPGRIIFCGNISGVDYTVPFTVPAGIYSISTSGRSYNVRSTKNFSYLPRVITGFMGLKVNEPSLKFYIGWDNVPFAQLNPRDVAFSTNQSNLIHDGTSFYFLSDFSGSTTSLLYSTDGITWSTRSVGTNNAPQPFTSTTGFSFVYNSSVTNKYIAGLRATSNNIIYSTDGITWTVGSVTLTGASGAWMPIINPNLTQKYLIWGRSITSATLIHTSTDGVTWTSRTTPLANVQFMASNGGSSGEVYVHTASGATTNNIATSTDGITWTSRSTGIILAALTVNYVGSNWFVTYGSNQNVISTSTDAITWTHNFMKPPLVPSTSNTVSSVVNNLAFLPIGSGAITSTDGVTWDYFRGKGNETIPQVYINNTYYDAVNGFNSSPDNTYVVMYRID